jgi:quinol monooxygenase YgiN
MLVIHAEMPVDPDHREEALDHVRTLVEASQAEEGTIEYRAATDLSDPNLVRIVERYEDDDAFTSHTETDHYREVEAAIADKLAGEPDVVRFEVDSATELDL